MTAFSLLISYAITLNLCSFKSHGEALAGPNPLPRRRGQPQGARNKPKQTPPPSSIVLDREVISNCKLKSAEFDLGEHPKSDKQ